MRASNGIVLLSLCACGAEAALPAPVTPVRRVVDGLLNGGFELVADGTTSPPKYGAYWLGAFSPEPGNAQDLVEEGDAFRGTRFLRLTAPVRQKIVADPRYAGELELVLAHRGGELSVVLEDGPGRRTSVELPPSAAWIRERLPLGRRFRDEHGEAPTPRLVLHLQADAPADVDEVVAVLPQAEVAPAEMESWIADLVRTQLHLWYEPEERGGLGLVDPATGHVIAGSYDVDTGARGEPEKNLGLHTVHTLLVEWLREARRRGWEGDVERWTPRLATITATLLDRHFDERTGLPRTLSRTTGEPNHEAAVTVQAYVDFLLDAREQLQDDELRERCRHQAHRTVQALLALQAEHDIPPERAPKKPVWNEKEGRLVGDTSNWFGHIPDRLTPGGELELDRRFYTSWAILTGRSFWYELMRSPRAVLRVHGLDPHPEYLAGVRRAIEAFHRDWDASRYDLENDTDDHYGYIAQDLLAGLSHLAHGELPEALAVVQAATDHRLPPDVASVDDMLWIQAVRLGTACAGDSPRALQNVLDLRLHLGEQADPRYGEALLELAANDWKGRQLTNSQFTESFFEGWEMLCICFKGTVQGDCRDHPAGYWDGDVGDTFGGPPASAIDAQTIAFRAADPWGRAEILGRLGVLRHVTETALARPYGYLFGLDEAVARQYELPDKYVIGLASDSAAGLGYVMAWLRLLPWLEDLPKAPALDGQLITGEPGDRVHLFWSTGRDAFSGRPADSHVVEVEATEIVEITLDDEGQGRLERPLGAGWVQLVGERGGSTGAAQVD